MRRIIKSQPRGFGLVVTSLGAVVAGIMTPFVLYSNGTMPNSVKQDSQDDNSNLQSVPGQLQKGTPSYKTLLPSGKTIQQLGGWTKVSPPNRDPVYAYIDQIGNIPIRVSQQAMPKDFKGNVPEKVAELALAYAADKKLNAGDAIAYIGTSAKGPQSVIVAKNNVLILIKASAAIPNSEWEKYIKSLG